MGDEREGGGEGSRGEGGMGREEGVEMRLWRKG
jgi:hypothetical protein